jgi:uncharacterized C2H2 Zn-finger protein
MLGRYTFRCPVCGKVFMSDELLQNHKIVIHSTNNKNKNCANIILPSN